VAEEEKETIKTENYMIAFVRVFQTSPKCARVATFILGLEKMLCICYYVILCGIISTSVKALLRKHLQGKIYWCRYGPIFMQLYSFCDQTTTLHMNLFCTKWKYQLRSALCLCSTTGSKHAWSHYWTFQSFTQCHQKTLLL